MAEPGASRRTVSVEGRARLRVPPDAASVSVGVEVTLPSLPDARAEAARASAAVMAALRAAGVAEADLRTTRYDVSVARTYESERNEYVSVGHSVEIGLAMVVRDLARLGDVLDAAVGAGANDVRGPAFFRTDTVALEDEARLAAIADARRKAEQMATAVGARLGPVRLVQDGGWGSGTTSLPSTAVFDASGGDNTPRTHLAVGDLEIPGAVAVEWELV